MQTHFWAGFNCVAVRMLVINSAIPLKIRPALRASRPAALRWMSFFPPVLARQPITFWSKGREVIASMCSSGSARRQKIFHQLYTSAMIPSQKSWAF